MGLIGSAIKIAAGTTIAKSALNSVYNTITNKNVSERLEAGQSTYKKACPTCGYMMLPNENFCPNCGYRMTDNVNYFYNEISDEAVHDNAKYGSYASVLKGNDDNQYASNDKVKQESTNTQSSGFENSTICPHCGAPLNLQTMSCEYCGYEKIDPARANSVQELSKKLTEIDKRRFVWNSRKKSALEGSLELILKKDKDTELREAAMEEFQEQKIEDKINTILNFQIPNSGEEILEFMLLAQSNVSTKDDCIDELEEAWVTKMEEAHQRAELLLGNSPKMKRIETVYQKKIAELNDYKEKKKSLRKNILIGVLMFIGIIELEVSTIIGIAFILASLCVLYFTKFR